MSICRHGCSKGPTTWAAVRLRRYPCTHMRVNGNTFCARVAEVGNRSCTWELYKGSPGHPGDESSTEVI